MKLTPGKLYKIIFPVVFLVGENFFDDEDEENFFADEDGEIHKKMTGDNIMFLERNNVRDENVFLVGTQRMVGRTRGIDVAPERFIVEVEL